MLDPFFRPRAFDLKAQNCETVARGVPDLANVWEKLKLKPQNCKTVVRSGLPRATFTAVLGLHLQLVPNIRQIWAPRATLTAVLGVHLGRECSRTDGPTPLPQTPYQYW